MEQCRVCISKATYPFSLTPLVVKQQIQEVIHTLSIGTQPRKGWPRYRDLRPIFFPVYSGVGSFRSHKYQISPVGPTVFLPYPRRLQSVTVFRCRYEGSTFFLVI